MNTDAIRTVLEALPTDYLPSRVHMSDLMVRTHLPIGEIEAALDHLSELGLLVIDKSDPDPFHPSESRYHAGRVFARNFAWGHEVHDADEQAA